MTTVSSKLKFIHSIWGNSSIVNLLVSKISIPKLSADINLLLIRFVSVTFKVIKLLLHTDCKISLTFFSVYYVSVPVLLVHSSTVMDSDLQTFSSPKTTFLVLKSKSIQYKHYSSSTGVSLHLILHHISSDL